MKSFDPEGLLAARMTLYTREIKPLLPPVAFEPSTMKLGLLGGHLIVVLAGYVIVRHDVPWLRPLGSLLIGHSLACIGFLTHELSHNSLVRRPALRYPLEAFFWALNLVPATLWRRVHNET